MHGLKGSVFTRRVVPLDTKICRRTKPAGAAGAGSRARHIAGALQIGQGARHAAFSQVAVVGQAALSVQAERAGIVEPAQAQGRQVDAGKDRFGHRRQGIPALLLGANALLVRIGGWLEANGYYLCHDYGRQGLLSSPAGWTCWDGGAVVLVRVWPNNETTN